jgi:molybdenum cofactor synthesis domain-containing protein
VAVLTVSDGVTDGTREDLSGAALAELAAAAGYDVAWQGAVPDERDQIAAALARLCDGDAAELVLTTGGTGFALRDVTPEATRDVVERLAPGLDEALRADALRHTPHGMLSRGVSGIRGGTIVVNLPGSPRACREGFAVLAPVAEHAIRLLRAEATSHAPSSSPPAAS